MNDQNSASEFARALAARRRRILGQCAICGRAFTGLPGRSYCSKSCKNRAEYLRRLTRASQQEKGR